MMAQQNNFMEENLKKEMTASIKSRIESEHRKHPNLDWAQLAAMKIVGNIEYLYDIKKKSEGDTKRGN